MRRLFYSLPCMIGFNSERGENSVIIFNYIVVCLVFGTTFLAIKVGMDAAAPPFFSAGTRFLVAGLVLYLLMVLRKKASFTLFLRKEMLLSGIGLTFGTFACLYWGEQYISSGIAAVLSATGPLIILVLQAVLLKQKGGPLSVIGVLVGLAGVALLVLPSITVSTGKWWVIGCLVVLLGEVFYSAGALYSKWVTELLSEVSPIALNSAQMIYGGALLLLLSALTEQVEIGNMLRPAALGSLLYLIVFGSMIGHSLFYWLVAKTNPVFPSTWLYVSPLIALTIGALFYGESVNWVSVAGGVTIIVGTILTNWDNLKPLRAYPSKVTKNERDSC